MTTYGACEAIARFWAFVDRETDPDGCWVWLGHRMTTDYGTFSVDGRRIPATHFALALVGSFLEPDQFALHSCDNPPCVRPDHLRPGSRSDNAQDALERGRFFRRTTTHCLHGHEYTLENTYRDPKTPTRRHCRACRQAASSAYWSRRRQAAV